MRLFLSAHGALERGSVLLLGFVIVSLLAAVAMSSHQQTTSLIHQLRDTKEATQATLLAESGLALSYARLAKDQDWTGTGASPIAMATGQSFSVTAKAAHPAFDNSVEAVVYADGFTANGRSRYKANLHIVPGVNRGNSLALLFFGHSLDLLNSTVGGDILIADQLNVVTDLVLDPVSGWSLQSGGPFVNPVYDFNTSSILGDVYKYTNKEYFVGRQERRISGPIALPEFELDQYLVPGPDRIIYTNISNLSNVSHEETAVFVITKGNTLSLSNCHFPGGVVIHVTDDYTPFDGADNKVIIKKGTTIGGGSGGVCPNIGLIAPGTELEYVYQGGAVEGTNDIEGLTVVNKVHLVDSIRLKGMVIVLTEIKHFRDTVIEFDPKVTENFPIGINFSLSRSVVKVLEVSELFDGPVVGL